MKNYIKSPDNSNFIEPHNVRLRQIYEELKRTIPIEILNLRRKMTKKRQTHMELVNDDKKEEEEVTKMAGRIWKVNVECVTLTLAIIIDILFT